MNLKLGFFLVANMEEQFKVQKKFKTASESTNNFGINEELMYETFVLLAVFQ